MAAAMTMPGNEDKVNFEFKHLGSIIQLTIPASENQCTLDSIVFRSTDNIVSDWFVTKATLNLTKNTVSPTKYANSFTVKSQNTKLREGEEAKIHFFISPNDLNDRIIAVDVYKDNNTKPALYQLKGRTFRQGYLYLLTAEPRTETIR